MQCFKTYKSNIQKRIDPYFYSPEHNINLGSYNILTFADICNVITDGDHGNPQYAENCDGIPYLRVVDVKNNLINYKSMQYITKEYSERLYKSCFAHENNLLISIVGTLGESVLYKDSTPLAISRGFAILEFNEKVIPEYVLAYTKTSIFNKQIQKNKVGSVQDGIYLQSLKEIKIPIPSLDEQQKIAQLALNAYENKSSKEKEVKDILTSFEKDVLNTLKFSGLFAKNKKCYCINSSKIRNNRLDTEYYQPYFIHMQEMINNSDYDKVHIGKISEFITGFAFSSDDYVKENGIKLLTIKNIRNNTIDLSNATLLPYEYKEIFNSFLIKYGDIVIAMTGATIGKCAIFDKDEEVLLNQRVGIIRVFEDINPIYLSIYLNLKPFQLEIIQKSCGGAQPNISADEIKKIKIILPKLSIQNQIADEYLKSLSKVKNIINNSKMEFEKAKAEVEKMILGE